MSLKTILPISSIPLIDDCNIFVHLGNVGKSVWSLRPKWDRGELVYFEIFRTTSAARVELEIDLKHVYYDDDEYENVTEKTFNACFEDGQTTVRILAGWPEDFEGLGGDLKGSITIYNECIKCSKCAIKRSLIVKKPGPLSHLSNDLLVLLNNPDFFADATLKCGTTEIPVHKNILSARSPVFAAMFKSQMQESRGVIDIVDIEDSVMKATLKYIYSGKTDPLTDVLAGDLLFAADKYQLEELKLICIDKLKSSLTVENVSRILVLGNLHDESLKSHAKEFVCKCDTFSELEKTEEWSALEREHPDLAIEVLKSALKSSQNNLNDLTGVIK